VIDPTILIFGLWCFLLGFLVAHHER